jgi:aminobenzoyl-glutamate utilization protein A
MVMDWNLLQKKIICYRRDIHAFPEAGWTEFRTTSKIAAILDHFGFRILLGAEILDLSSILGRDANIIPMHMKRALSQGADPEWLEKMQGFTGVVGILDTGKPGPVVSCRFDIDAVETSEAADSKHFPFREGFASQNGGVMHACGHDGHTAIGLGLAEALFLVKDKLAGKVQLIFQPAEEGVRGSRAIVEKGILNDSDFFFAMHLGMGIPTGTFFGGSLGFLCTRKLDVNYHGRSSHAGLAPNEGHNALLAAASATLNLHAIPRHGSGASRVNVGVLSAGEGRNVVAPTADMKIEVRGQTEDINDYVYRRALQILKSSAEMYEVDCEIKVVGESFSTRSDEEIVDLVCGVASSSGLFNSVGKYLWIKWSDDAAGMMKKVQETGGRSTYMILGSDLCAGHHNAYFDFDESVLFKGVRVLLDSILKVCQK